MWDLFLPIHTNAYLKVENMPAIGFEIKRKCKVCGEVFLAKTLDSQYCSPKCSKVAWKRKYCCPLNLFLSIKKLGLDSSLGIQPFQLPLFLVVNFNSSNYEQRYTFQRTVINQNEELLSLIKSGKGVYPPPKVFWWWVGITYFTSLYSLWCLLQLIFQWLKW